MLAFSFAQNNTGIMYQTSLEAQITEIITPSLKGLGYDLVRVKLMENERRKVLQVMIDRIDEVSLHIDDCAAASRQISALLDVEDPIKEKYHLEVSSPGMDRPLTRKKDFADHLGYITKIETLDHVEERRRFTGRLVSVEDDAVVITADVVPAGAEDVDAIAIAFDNIKSAKLVMNDELLGRSTAANE